MNDRKVGEVFYSKVTGCKLVVTTEDEKRPEDRCNECAYGKKFYYGYDYCRMLRELRRLEAGDCSSFSRSDFTPVYFKVVEVIYNISETTKKTIVNIEYAYFLNAITVDEKDMYKKLLIEIEYIQYSK